MARISTYAIDGTPASSDKLIGTDSSGTTTKNYPLGSVSDWLKESGASAVLGQNNYTFQIVADPDTGRLPGTISFDNYGGDGTEFSNITTFRLSKISSTGKNVGDYLLSTVGDKVILGQLDDLNNFGVYTLVSLVENPSETGFYDATLLFVEGNGALLGNGLYGLATHSASESAVWGNIEGTVTNQTDLVDYIDAEIAAIPVPATPTLQSVTDAGNTTTNGIFSGRHTITQASTQQLKIHYGGGNPVWGFTGASYFNIEKNGSPVLRIDSSSRFGIGTTAPSEKLDVVGDIASQGIYVDRTHESGGSSNPFAKFGLHYFHGSSNSLTLQKVGNDNEYIFGTQTGYLMIKNAGSGNYLLLSQAAQSVQSGSGTFNLGVVQHGAANNNYGNYISVTNSPNATGTKGRVDVNGDLRIIDYSTSSAIEKTKLKNDGSAYFSGNVGIGTTAPADKLHVKGGNIRIDSSHAGGQNLQFRNNGSANALLSNTYNILGGSASATDFNTYVYGDNSYSLWTNSVNRLSVDGSGNVGIGTTNPFAQLEVKKDSYTQIRVRGNSDIYKHLGLSHSGNFAYVTGSRSQLMLQSGDATYQYPMNFYTGGSARMVIDETGNVGIGTTAPSAKLEVIDPVVNGPQARFKYSADYYLDVGYNRVLSYLAGTQDFRVGTGDGFPMSLVTDNTQRLTITSDGNVGIGTTTPSEKLHVVGDVRIQGNSISLGDTNSTITKSSSLDSFISSKTLVVDKGVTNQRAKLKDTGLYISRTSNGDYSSYIQGANNNLDIKARSDIKFFGNSSAILTVRETNQSVGIGTTAPSALLEIKSNSTNDFLKLTTGGGGATPVKLIFEKSLGEQGVIEYNRNGDLEMYNTDQDGGVLISGSGSANADMYVNHAGNVGIGTTSPDSKLHTVGNSTQDLATLGSELLNAQTASGTGWTGTDIEQGYTHTPGNSDRLVTTFTPVPNAVYLIDIAVTGLTAGRVDIIYLGGQQRAVYTGNTSSRKISIRTTTADPLEVFVQSATDGTVSFLSIKEVQSSNPSVTFGSSLQDDALEFRAPNSNSVYIGKFAGRKRISEFNTTNIGIGYASLSNNVEGTQNIALGYNTLTSTANSSYNIAIGSNILSNYKKAGNTYNIGIGTSIMSGNAITTASGNIIMGHWSGQNMTTAANNVGIGYDTLKFVTSGNHNITMGGNSLQKLTTGSVNISIGSNSMQHITTGGNNIALGYQAGRYASDNSQLTTNSNSIFMGRDTKSSAVGANNEIVIGYQAEGIGSNSVVLGNDSIATTALKGSVGIGTTTPNSKVHINGTAMEQLRMETSGGPGSSGDTNGRIGDMAYDDDYFYIKTANGWGRMALDFAF